MKIPHTIHETEGGNCNVKSFRFVIIFDQYSRFWAELKISPHLVTELNELQVILSWYVVLCSCGINWKSELSTKEPKQEKPQVAPMCWWLESTTCHGWQENMTTGLAIVHTGKNTLRNTLKAETYNIMYNFMHYTYPSTL